MNSPNQPPPNPLNPNNLHAFLEHVLTTMIYICVFNRGRRGVQSRLDAP